MNTSSIHSFRQSVPLILLFFWLGLVIWILYPFFLTLLWAIIISFIFFPIYKCLNHYVKNDTLSAGFLTLIMTIILITLAFSLLNLIENEITTTYQLLLENFVESSWQLPEKIRNTPYFGSYLQNTINQLVGNHHSLVNHLIDFSKQSSTELVHFFGSAGERILKLGFIFVTVFFCFRDGELWLQQAKKGLNYFLGDSHSVYFLVAGDTTRAVFYGVVLAALGQGFTAGIGYYIADVKMSLLLAILTTLLALIPMGAMLIWLPTALMLIINNQLFAGFGLLLWGFFAISTIDNIIRPLVICGTSKIPFLVVMFGVFGGLSTFGSIGLFLGPVILSVLLAVWKNFISSMPPEHNAESHNCTAR